MAKIKMKKKSTSTDMTAMCDVAFLLLTFFILTATSKLPEALPVDTPSSTEQTKLPDSDLITLTVGDGKVFFDLKGKDVRVKTLELMAEKYGVEFSEKDKYDFSLMTDFGVPIGNLKQIIEMNSADRIKANQPGIPLDSLNNQLKDWVLNAREANVQINNKEPKVAIKGDSNEEYGAIKKILDLLQDQNINSFSLVTGLRGKDF